MNGGLPSPVSGELSSSFDESEAVSVEDKYPFIHTDFNQAHFSFFSFSCHRKNFSPCLSYFWIYCLVIISKLSKHFVQPLQHIHVSKHSITSIHKFIINSNWTDVLHTWTSSGLALVWLYFPDGHIWYSKSMWTCVLVFFHLLNIGYFISFHHQVHFHSFSPQLAHFLFYCLPFLILCLQFLFPLPVLYLLSAHHFPLISSLFSLLSLLPSLSFPFVSTFPLLMFYYAVSDHRKHASEPRGVKHFDNHRRGIVTCRLFVLSDTLGNTSQSCPSGS